MPDANQDAGRAPSAPDASPPAPAPLEPDGGTAAAADLPPRPDADRGLIGWLATIAATGLAGLVLQMQELAGLAAGSGVFIIAQAADADRRWRVLYNVISVAVAVLAVVVFLSLNMLVQNAGVGPALEGFLAGFVGWAAIVSVLLWVPQVSAALVQLYFRGRETSHTLRLTARLITIGFLVAIPSFAFRDTILEMLRSAESPLTDKAFIGSLIGYVMLALAGTGFLVKRTAAETWERLGLRAPGPRDLLVAALATALLFGFTALADVVERRYFPALWREDHAMVEAMAGHLGVVSALLLGLSAGIGEEITLRGGLQPRLGIVTTALLFAVLHVQYTWFGIVVIFVLGMLLGLLRARTSTTVVILAHALYDVISVLAT